MAGKSASIDYSRCEFKHCRNGICRAMGACEKKVLKQEGPFEPPYININICSGCNKCLPSCPAGAIKRSK